MNKKDKCESINYLDEFIDGTATIDGSTYDISTNDIVAEDIVVEDIVHDWQSILNDFKNGYYNSISSTTINSTGSTIGPPSYDNTTINKHQWKPTTSVLPTSSGGAIYPYPNYPNGSTWGDSISTSTTTDITSITIHDENGNLKVLSIAEVSRYYAEALEYRKIKRFAKLFPMVKELLNELLVAMKLSDPYDEDELDRLEEELKESKKKK